MKDLMRTTMVLIIVFFFIGIVANIVLFTTAYFKIDKGVNLAVKDAIELTISDGYKTDHISRIDPSAFSDNLNLCLEKKFNLDNNFAPAGPSIINEKLMITTKVVDPGEYTYDANTESLTILRNPSLHIAGYSNMPSLMPFFAAKIRIPFDIVVRNTRVD